MLLTNLKFKPVRLEMTRVASNLFVIKRDNEKMGQIWKSQDDEWSYRKNMSVGYKPSFRTAVLAVSRFSGIGFGSRTQDYGWVRKIRVHRGGQWFTFLAKGDHMYLLKEHNWEDPLEGVEKAVTQGAISEALRFLRETG